LSDVNRDFLKQSVAKDAIESPGPGTYVNPDLSVQELANPKLAEQKALGNDHHLKNNPFGKGDPRFEY